MDDYYRHHRAIVHRGVYPLAAEATELFEGARDARSRRSSAAPARDTIFTKQRDRGAQPRRLLLGPRERRARRPRSSSREMEHHSNFVPWQMLARETGAELRGRSVDDDGPSAPRRARRAARRRQREGRRGRPRLQRRRHDQPGRRDRRAAPAPPAPSTVVDGSQAVPQMPVDVGALDADFYAWTGHKAYGPTGVGVLHGRRELLEAMPPFIGGGHMISSVTFDEVRWAELPGKFEAGTSAIAEVDRPRRRGRLPRRDRAWTSVRAHERELTGLRARAPRREVAGPDDPRPARRRAPRRAGRRSRSTASTRTTSPRSSAATASASAPATTAPSR